MAKDVISVNGKDVVVREDTAKAFRGVNWAMASLIAFIAITTGLFIIFSFVTPSNRDANPPTEIDKR